MAPYGIWQVNTEAALISTIPILVEGLKPLECGMVRGLGDSDHLSILSIPSDDVVWESASVLAFRDRYPVSPGHTLVVTRTSRNLFRCIYFRASGGLAGHRGDKAQA
ncbi:MAG: HIT domain-containing protein [Gammaproteobacteria bacterium]|nr:HIT domain-containing protein [Gammaproteobacteria bacterium]